MDQARMDRTAAEPLAHDRCMERARALAAVKFMGLSAPLPEPEPPPGLLDRVRSLLFRA